MVKSKFPGKPSKINQRNLVSAYSVSIPSYDSSSISEDVCYGLSFFDKIFGYENEVSDFNGFNFYDIQSSYRKREQYNVEIQKKFAQRGLNYTPLVSSVCCPAVTESTEETFVSKFAVDAVEKSDTECISFHTKKEHRKRGRSWMFNKKIMNRYHSKIQMRHNFKTFNKNCLIRFKHKASSNYLSDKYCRKFILPPRSLHSSRVIKPNKRFLDAEKNSKSRIISKGFISNKHEINAESNIEYVNLKCSGVVPSNKVIIREARLNITTEPVVAGPFSIKKNTSFDKDKFRSGMITCGVCGIVRYYKYILQTKKFGVYSCEPCRRFILKMIKQSKQPHYEIIKCKAENGMGKCVIPCTMTDKQKEYVDDSSSKNVRCSACWLILCLQRFMMPNAIRKSLMKLIPEDLKVFSSNVVSVDLKKSLHCESENRPVNTIVGKIDEVNDNLKKRLRMNYFLKSVSFCKRTLEKNEVNLPMKFKSFVFKRNVINRRTNSKNKWIQESVHKENIEKDHHNPRGPRIKHVCRSASSVLKTSFVALNDSGPEEPLCISQESDSDPQIQKDYIRTEKQNQTNKIRNCDNDSSINQTCGEFINQQYGARSLQDFRKESSDESDENEDKLISIDFWEAYDPDEIFKTGFPLISSDPINVRALCFLCGSTGLEKLLYCVCCCEPYHWFCAEGPSAFWKESEVDKCRVNWVCRKCKVCSTCGEGGPKLLMSCQRCRDSYHAECLSNKALNKRLFRSDRPWVCPTCLKCKSCNGNSVSTYVGNVPLCSQCFKLRQKGNYCPLCQGCYRDEDYNVQMMECGICKCWIHAKCEGISHEKYQILSFLPETIEFVCRLCCSIPPAQWWVAVEDGLKAGYLGILKSLCKNKLIGDLFKESPKKDLTCRCSKRQIIGKTSDFATSKNESEFKNVEGVMRVRRCLTTDDESDENNMHKMKVIPCDDKFNESRNLEQLTEVNVDRCNICCNNTETRTKINHRLLMIKANVHNNQYSSLLAFHQELENVISEVEELTLVGTYREILKQFFPWFEPESVQCENTPENVSETGQMNDSTFLSDWIENSCSSDDDYATLQKLVTQDEYKYENFRILDVRTCNLCKGMGEAIPSEGGRLIYCGRNEWVHSNCALWSSEVFEEIDGSLQNVHSAISRGRQIRCFVCEKKGASVGCCFKNCSITYHFSCAKKVRCKFFQNKTIYCGTHDVPEISLPLFIKEKDFEILRPVYVEMDRKKKRLECHANVKLRIGSLHVESLGRIDPHLSDNPKHILPVYFRCTRLYWSTSKPWKIVQYHIQIKVSYSFQQHTMGEADVNYTVSHSENENGNVDDNEKVAHQVVNDLVNKICGIKDDYECNNVSDLTNGNNTNGSSSSSSNNNNNNDLLFPELQDAIYKDLPNDVLNDNTLHDIWNNYDNGNNNDIDNECATAVGDIQQSVIVAEKNCHYEANIKKRTDTEIYSNGDCTQPNMKKQQLEATTKLNGGIIDEPKITKKYDKFTNDKYLRDKNDFEGDVFSKKNHRGTTANTMDEFLYDEIRSRVTIKRKINVENSTSIARKKLCENDFAMSNVQYYPSYESILQLDGMVDIYNDEEPVKCVQCRRTYRTTLSFERHLETCNSDFSDCTISSCESDSASGEEEKFTSSVHSAGGKCTTYEAAVVAAPPSIKNSVSTNLAENRFSAKFANTYAIAENNEKVIAVGVQPSYATDVCASIDLNTVYPYAATTYEDVRFIDNGGVINDSGLQSAMTIQTVLHNLKQESTSTTVSPITIATATTVAEPTMKVNFVDAKTAASMTSSSSSCANYAETQFTLTNMSETQTYEIQNMVATPIPTPAQTAPTYVLQSFPKTEIVPTYVAVNSNTINDCMRSSDTLLSHPLQLQQIAAVNQPSSLSFQPLIPTIFGTIVQPSVIETPTYIVNTASATAAAAVPNTELFAPQNNIILPSQSMFAFGMETAVVSNTVMSSSQFMTQSPTGNVGGASAMYSTTTTQVFQAAKQLPQPDFSSGFIVLNSASVPPQATVQSLQPAVTVQVPKNIQQMPLSQPTQSRTVSTPNIATKYMYVQINEVSKNAGTAESKKPIIMKPAKQNAPSKKAVKVMKVKNNRPVAIQTKDDTIPIPNNGAVHVSKKIASSEIGNIKNEAVNVKHLQIKTTDKTFMCQRSGVQMNNVNNYMNKSQRADKCIVANNQYHMNGLDKTMKSIVCEDQKKVKKPERTIKDQQTCVSIDYKRVGAVGECVTPVNETLTQEQKQIELKNIETVMSSSSQFCHNSEVRSFAADLKNVSNEAVMAQQRERNSSKNIEITALELPCEQKAGLGSFTSANILKNGNTDSEICLTKNTASLTKSNERVNILDETITHTPFNSAVNNTQSTNKLFVERSLHRNEPSTTSESISETDRIFDELVRQHNERSSSLITKNKQELVEVSETLQQPESQNMSCFNDNIVSEKPNGKIQSCCSDSLTTQSSKPVNISKNVTHDSISELVDHNENKDKPLVTAFGLNRSRYVPHVNQYRKCSLENGNSCDLNQDIKMGFPSKKKNLKTSLSESSKATTANVIFATTNNTATNNTITSTNLTSNNMPNSKTNNTKSWRTASISYEVNAEDGFSYKTNNLLDLWNKILESVQQSRVKYKLPLLPKNALVNAESVYSLLGFENNASKYLLEQLPDAWKCIFYKPVFHKSPLQSGKTTLVENESGCARTEPFTSSHKYDMFGWLASRHRKPPKFMMISDSDIVNGNRRIASLNLPMAMRFRHLKETAKETVGVFRSDIHGRGLFCLRDIDAGEMVIEYAGEVIRSTLTDKREKYYTSKGIGCYMFRIDDKYVVDATMCGNAARFINHSCEPNCYSRIVDILGKKHILIFALRRIPKGEELTYDYKFPLEDDKIFCHCLSRKCRKYLN